MNFLVSATQLPLHDIVDEHSVSWWPLAVGWWLVIAALLLGLIVFTLWWRRLRKQRRLHKRIEAALHTPATSISELNLRLKQILLIKYPRSQLAHLNAEAWQQRLAAELPDSQRDDFLAQLTPYTSLQYQSHDQTAVDAYQALALSWWKMVRPGFTREKQNV